MAKKFKQLSRQIKKVEEKEKKGSYGSWRKQFCRKYMELLARAQKNTYSSLVETLAPKGEEITCLRGCIHCCFHYVTVSLAQGIVIADYLYKSRDYLEQFINNHEKWHQTGYPIAEKIDRTRIDALSASTPIDRIITDTRSQSEGYLDMNIPCPFLVDKKCFIYKVRPLSCSGHYAVTAPSWCSPSTDQKPYIYQMIPNDQDLTELTLLSDPRISLYELALPTMIYRLLTEGAAPIMDEIVQQNFG